MEVTKAGLSTLSKTSYNTKKDDTTADKIKDGIKDNSTKITVGLSALGVMALAALAIKKGKPQEVIKEVKDTAVKTVKEKADDAAGAVIKGENYTQIKKTATNNLNKNNKKVVKEALSTARDAKLEAEKLVRQNMIQNSQTVNQAQGVLKNANQGIKHATVDGLAQKGQIAKEEAAKAAESAAEYSRIALEKPTHRNIKYSKVVENRSLKAQNNAQKIADNIAKRKQQIEEAAIRKQENIAKMQASTTPEILEKGQQKMQENAQKAQAKAIKRAAKRDVNKPGYQRALNNLRERGSEQLQGVINSSKSSPVEKRVAQDLIG